MRSSCLNSKLLQLVASIGIFLMLCIGDAFAVDWSLSPSVSVSELYDSNINFSFQDKQSDFITAMKPRFLVSGQTDQDQLNLDSTLVGMIYVDNSQLDRFETYNDGSWVRQWSSRFSTDFGGNFIKTTALESQLQEAGIRTILADQYIYNVRGKGSYALTEVLSLSLGGSAGQTWYPDKQFPDSDNALGNLNLAWKSSEFDTIGLDCAYSYRHYLDTSTDTVQFVRPGLYWERALGETTTLLLGAGYRFTSIKYFNYIFQFEPPDQVRLVKKWTTDTKSTYDFLATLKTSWTDRLSSSFIAGRDQYSDVDARTYDHMYVGTGVRYGLTDLTTVNCDVRYDYNNEIAQGTQQTDYVRVTPSIDRKLTKDLSVRLSGSYEYERQDVADNRQNADRFRAWIELFWQLPRLLESG